MEVLLLSHSFRTHDTYCPQKQLHIKSKPFIPIQGQIARSDLFLYLFTPARKKNIYFYLLKIHVLCDIMKAT